MHTRDQIKSWQNLNFRNLGNVQDTLVKQRKRLGQAIGVVQFGGLGNLNCARQA